jgi:hypothetical protein
MKKAEGRGGLSEEHKHQVKTKSLGSNWPSDCMNTDKKNGKLGLSASCRVDTNNDQDALKTDDRADGRMKFTNSDAQKTDSHADQRMEFTPIPYQGSGIGAAVGEEGLMTNSQVDTNIRSSQESDWGSNKLEIDLRSDHLDSDSQPNSIEMNLDGAEPSDCKSGELKIDLQAGNVETDLQLKNLEMDLPSDSLKTVLQPYSQEYSNPRSNKLGMDLQRDALGMDQCSSSLDNELRSKMDFLSDDLERSLPSNNLEIDLQSETDLQDNSRESSNQQTNDLSVKVQPTSSGIADLESNNSMQSPSSSRSSSKNSFTWQELMVIPNGHHSPSLSPLGSVSEMSSPSPITVSSTGNQGGSGGGGVKRYLCHECLKTFATSSKLKRHLKVCQTGLDLLYFS